MKPGATGSEPAAMIALEKRTIRRPSLVSTAKVWGEANCASPVTTVTLRWLGKGREAAGQALDDAVLESAQPSRSISGPMKRKP